MYLEPDLEETHFQAAHAYFAASIRTHDGNQVGWVGRELHRWDDRPWKLDNHKLVLGTWDADGNALADDPGVQGRGIGTAIATHIETELKAIMPELAQVATFSVDDVPELRIGGYQNARRGIGWDPDHQEFDERRGGFVPVSPRGQVRAIWERGGRDRVTALVEEGHVSAAQLEQVEALMTATRGAVPTPRQLSELGEDTPFTLPDGRVTHLGKELLLGSAWHGSKPL